MPTIAPLPPGPALPPGARVRVVAPAGPVPADRLRAGLRVLRESFGLDVEVHPGVSARDRYLAGGDAARLAALRDTLADEGIHALWCARGGYGCTRLLRALPALPPPRAAPPPLLVGFSDVSALHAVWGRWGWPSLHGPVVTQLGELDAPSRAWLAEALRSDALQAPPGWWSQAELLSPGRAHGTLRGGNLTVVAALAGTPWALDLRGAMVLLEDVGEPAYRVDRAARQLADACGLNEAAAWLLGSFTTSRPQEQTWIAALWRELAQDFAGPVIWGLPVGHSPANAALPLGRPASVDTEARRLRFCPRADAPPAEVST